jgi:hypothetical protein
VVLTRASAADMPSVLWRVMSSRARIAEHPHVEGFRGVGDVHVRSCDGRPVPVQVDGDHVGDAVDVRFGIAAGALRVVA